MSFDVIIPYGSKSPNDLFTSSPIEVQLWQEMTMLRHISGENEISGKIITAPWIDQAKIYFLDAFKSNWRSAGLLYYYSFLNIAKSYIVINRAVTGKLLKSASIYYGLTTNPQKMTRIADYEIDIHPPKSNTRKNIFACFYENLMDEKWPFSKNIRIKLSDILPYCFDISHEILNFYQIENGIYEIISLFRREDKNIWYDILVHKNHFKTILNYLTNDLGLSAHLSNVSPKDDQDWKLAFNILPGAMLDHKLIRINEVSIAGKFENFEYTNFVKTLNEKFKGYILPRADYNNNNRFYWYFIPKIELNKVFIKWHPILSNYLFSFALSNILRYHPHLFYHDSRDSFVAEAWCNQSAITTLRYFLMELSKQNIRIY